MKKLLTILFLLVFVAAKAQYTPNAGAYQYKGLKQTNSLQPPSTAGSPVTSVNAPDSNYAALYYNKTDTTWYQFNPISKTWSPFGGIGVNDSVFITSIDSIFITETDSIFIVSGADTIYIGESDHVRDTAKLYAGYGLYIISPSENDSSGVYEPNQEDRTIAIDTSTLSDFIVQVINSDTTFINNPASDTAIFFVDTIRNSPPVGVSDGYKVLVGAVSGSIVVANPTGDFAGHGEEIAELVGSVWNFTTPDNNDQLIVDNENNYTTWQYINGVWRQTARLVRWGGDRAVGTNAWIGRIDKQPLIFRAWNKIGLIVDTTRDVKLPKYTGLENEPLFFKPGTGGKIDTGRFDLPVYETPVIQDSVMYLDDGVVKYGTATGGSGTTETWGDISSGTWVNVMDYGAINDSTGGNYAAITAAMAALPASGGVIYFPSGLYICDSTIIVNKPITFLGAGGGGTAHPFKSSYMHSTSKIIMHHATRNLFYVDTMGVSFKDIGFQNSNSTTPTNGAAIYAQNAQQMRISNTSIRGFYDGVTIRNYAMWRIENSYIGFLHNGVNVADSIRNDDGDGIITGNLIAPNSASSNACIYQESGGGLKITNNKFLGGGTSKATYGMYHGDFTASSTTTTGLLIISNNSAENYNSRGIYLVPAGNFIGNVIINNNQLTPWSGTTTEIELSSISNVSIIGNVLRAGAAGSTAVKLTSVSNASVSNSYNGYTTPTVFTSCVNNLIDQTQVTDNEVLIGASSSTGKVETVDASAASDGDVLTLASGVPTWSAPSAGAGNISGTLTADRLVYSTGTNTIAATDNYRVDATKKWVSLGGGDVNGVLNLYSTYFPGTVSTTAGTNTVTGVGTTFLTSFSRGQEITIGAETKTIGTISSNTSITLIAASGNWANNNSGVSYSAPAAQQEIYRFLPNGDITQYGESLLKTGNSNTVALGYEAAEAMTTGNANVMVGYQAGKASTTGRENVLIGYQAGTTITTGIQNTIIGYGTTGSTALQNATYVGYQAGGTRSGNSNTAIGRSALSAATGTGTSNVAVGFSTGTSITNGANNTVLGASALNNAASALTGSGNTVIGATAGSYMGAASSNNVIIGYDASVEIGTTDVTLLNNSVIVGTGSEPSTDNETNIIVIGKEVTSNGSNTTTIGNSSTTDAHIAGAAHLNGRFMGNRSRTTTTTVLGTEELIFADATSGAFNVTLPTAVGRTGQTYTVVKTDASANAVTVNTTSSQNINGATTYGLATQYKTVTVVSNGTQWYIIAAQ